MNGIQQCHTDTFVAQLHSCAFSQPTLFLTPRPQHVFFLPLRIATADRFPLELTQPLEEYT